MKPPDDGMGEYCDDETFRKLTGGCNYREHFGDLNAIRQLMEAGETAYICPRCLKATVFNFENSVMTGVNAPPAKE